LLELDWDRPIGGADRGRGRASGGVDIAIAMLARLRQAAGSAGGFADAAQLPPARPCFDAALSSTSFTSCRMPGQLCALPR
jgi:hypothetical protein